MTTTPFGIPENPMRNAVTDKPDDVTQEAWDDADRVLSRYIYGKESPRYSVARAIMAAKAEERGACARLIEEGYERAVDEAYRSDGKPSKNDKCAHDRYMYEDCESCAVTAIRNRSNQS